jgi:hypothetical protein
VGKLRSLFKTWLVDAGLRGWLRMGTAHRWINRLGLRNE